MTPRRPALIAAVALLVLAVWEVSVLLRAGATAPTGADWAAVRARVDAGFRSGDLIVSAPAWMDPVVRLHLGQHLTIDDVARMDAARYPRVWEVSARGAASPDATGRLVSDERIGALRLRLFEREPARVLWDLRSRSELLEVDYGGKRCVPLRVPGKLDAGAVPLGSKLVARAGLSDFRTRRDNRAFARVRLLVDGVEAAQVSVGSESGWLAFPQVATRPGSGRVELVADVDPARGGQPAVLNLCVAAEARQ